MSPDPVCKLPTRCGRVAGVLQKQTRPRVRGLAEAERGRFELPRRLTPSAGFRNRYVQPLCHLSEVRRRQRVRQRGRALFQPIWAGSTLERRLLSRRELAGPPRPPFFGRNNAVVRWILAGLPVQVASSITPAWVAARAAGSQARDLRARPCARFRRCGKPSSRLPARQAHSRRAQECGSFGGCSPGTT